MYETATCEYCSEIFEAAREFCPKCGKQLPQEIKATVVIEQFSPDCSSCHGLCCKALAFDWPHYKKKAGVPCKHLTGDFKCGNWDQLEADGFVECRSYNCYGAGQTVAKLLEEQHPNTWRTDKRVQQAEMGIFQKVYTELYEDINKKSPKVGNLGNAPVAHDDKP
jgi:hypothetical protein